ncbi:hypothetical protein HY251_21700, partial [bacterium]|nr:hypothetical protein [bacterium]
KTEVLYWKRWKKTGPLDRGDGKTKGAPEDVLATLTPGKTRYLNARKPDGSQASVGDTVTVRIIVSFSKPMRAASDPAPEPAQIELGVLDPVGAVALVSSRAASSIATTKHWINDVDDPNALFKQNGSVLSLGSLRYDFDSFTATVPLNVGPNGATVKDGALFFQSMDQVKLNLDGNPETVATFAQLFFKFAGYEDGQGAGNDGGTDRSHKKIQIDTIPPKLGHK